MIRIEHVENKEEKTKVTLEIMKALPEWFSPPEDIEKSQKFIENVRLSLPMTMKKQ